MKDRLLHALLGIVATLLGLAAGELLAALIGSDASPIDAVGGTVVDATPVSLKNFAIEQFGSNDKNVLIGTVVVVVLLLAAVAGAIAKTRLRLGEAIFVVLVLIAIVAATLRPGFGVTDLLPGVLTGVVGVAALWWLVRTARTGTMTSRSSTEPETGAGAGTETAAAAPEGLEAASVAQAGTHRRTVLVAAGISLAVAAVMGGAGRLVSNLRARPEDFALPEPVDPLAPLPQGLSDTVSGITPLRVSNADFYRVDTRLDVPVLSTDGWTLTIDGDVEREVTFTFDDILAMDQIERDITLTCVSNSVGGPYVGGTRWQGVRLMDLLERAGIDNTQADQLIATDFDGMTIGTPMTYVTDGRDAMLAIGMNGEPLPREHGFPARIVIPGLYGFISATKWVRRLTLTTYAETESYWTQRDWATDAPIRPSSRIDTPKALASLSAGQTVIGGVAWAQADGGVSKVQVQIDGGGWQDATLGPDVNEIYWRQWSYPWQATSGQHRLSARVIDGQGQVQTDTRREPFPSGSSGIQEIIVNVS